VRVERLENPQVTYPICARICARDAAGRIETGEMPTLDSDTAPPVDRGKDGHRRQPDTGRDARRSAHNPEVAGSNPTPATKARGRIRIRVRPLACILCMGFVHSAQRLHFDVV
jgi:hypothetical protein